MGNFMTLDTSLLPFQRGLLPAVARGDEKAVKAILEEPDERMRADANLRDSRGAPLLHKAVRVGSQGIVKLLMRQPGLKVNARDRYLKTAVDIARENENNAIALILKE